MVRRNKTMMYCNYCDSKVADWKTGKDGAKNCPSCYCTLHNSKEDYISEMVRWLGKKFGWSEDDVQQFLFDNGNPGKGQALALISTRERQTGEYIHT